MKAVEFDYLLSTLDQGYNSILFYEDISKNQLAALKYKIQGQNLNIEQVILFKYSKNIKNLLTDIFSQVETIIFLDEASTYQEVMDFKMSFNDEVELLDFYSFVYLDGAAALPKLVCWHGCSLELKIQNIKNGFNKSSFKLLMKAIEKGNLLYIFLIHCIADLDDELIEDFFFALKSGNLKYSAIRLNADLNYDIKLFETLQQTKFGILQLGLDNNSTQTKLSKVINIDAKYYGLMVEFDNNQEDLNAPINELNATLINNKLKLKNLSLSVVNVSIPTSSSVLALALNSLNNKHSTIENLCITNLIDT